MAANTKQISEAEELDVVYAETDAWKIPRSERDAECILHLRLQYAIDKSKFFTNEYSSRLGANVGKIPLATLVRQHGAYTDAFLRLSEPINNSDKTTELDCYYSELKPSCLKLKQQLFTADRRWGVPRPNIYEGVINTQSSLMQSFNNLKTQVDLHPTEFEGPVCAALEIVTGNICRMVDDIESKLQSIPKTLNLNPTVDDDFRAELMAMV